MGGGRALRSEVLHKHADVGLQSLLVKQIRGFPTRGTLALSGATPVSSPRWTDTRQTYGHQLLCASPKMSPALMDGTDVIRLCCGPCTATALPGLSGHAQQLLQRPDTRLHWAASLG